MRATSVLQVVFLVVAVCASLLVQAAPARTVITYNQTQEGHHNVHADVENVLILIIPPRKLLSGINLLDIGKSMVAPLREAVGGGINLGPSDNVVLTADLPELTASGTSEGVDFEEHHQGSVEEEKKPDQQPEEVKPVIEQVKPAETEKVKPMTEEVKPMEEPKPVKESKPAAEEVVKPVTGTPKKEETKVEEIIKQDKLPGSSRRAH